MIEAILTPVFFVTGLLAAPFKAIAQRAEYWYCRTMSFVLRPFRKAPVQGQLEHRQ